MIMMQMTDFTRGTGPLKSTSDVIESARNIAKLGNDLDALASQIAEVNFCQLIKSSPGVPSVTHFRAGFMVLRLNKIFQACPEDWARNELSAHINKIKFYCHQLNMCAKVKAEVQNIAGELVVSGLDSATSLIQVKYYNETTSKHNYL